MTFDPSTTNAAMAQALRELRTRLVRETSALDQASWELLLEAETRIEELGDDEED